MNKKHFYILGILFCLYNFNIFFDIAICLITTYIMFKYIRKEEFYLFYFIIIFFEFVLKLPYLNGSFFRIYQLLFIIKLFLEFKEKKNKFNLNYSYLVLPIILFLTSILYYNISSIASLGINLFILIYIFSTKDKSINFYQKLLYVIGLFGAFTVIYGLYRGSQLNFVYFKRLSLTITDPNYSSILLNLSFFAILNNEYANKIEKYLIIILIIMGLILTVSISGIVCFILMLFVYYFIIDKKKFVKALIIFIILLFLFFTIPLAPNSALYGMRYRILNFNNMDLNTFTSFRLEIFENYFNYFINEVPTINKIFGGLNTITGNYSKKLVSMFGHISHNSYIDILYMTGILGFILLMFAILYNTFNDLRKNIKKNNIVAVNIFILKLIILYYCTNLSIFPYRYFIAMLMLKYDESLFSVNELPFIKQFENNNYKRILWFVNTIFPYPAKKINKNKSAFGGWLTSLHSHLINKGSLQIGIVSSYDGNEMKSYIDGNTIYYLIPNKNSINYNHLLKYYYSKVLEHFNPDIIHIHGTEFGQHLAVFDCQINAKVVTSIQGLTSVYADVYEANISKDDIYKNITIRDLLRHDTIYDQKRKFVERGLHEIAMLNKSNYIIGRTNWDYANALSITGIDKYYKCNEILRKSFYKGTWDVNKCNRNTIYYSQALYPIKGLHIMIKALSVVVKFYPNTKLYIAGNNIFKTNNIKDCLKLSGYARYINRLIKKYNLKDNIKFLGVISEDEVKKQLLNSNVFVQASSIENSPNALGEAMLLGVPVVASNVGGTSDLLIDKKEGLLYPYTEHAMLANYIMKIFSDDALATAVGTAAKAHATSTHNPRIISQDMIDIYNKIMEDEK